MITKLNPWVKAGLFAAAFTCAGPVLAQAAAPVVAAAAKSPIPVGSINKGDTTWMLISSALVLMMSVPGLALFYGGLVRTKNMLSVLMQVLMIVCMVAVVWCCYGYSEAFTDGTHQWGGFFGQFFGSTDNVLLRGIDGVASDPVKGTAVAATFSNGVYLPALVFVAFQATFACITPALIVGAFAERIKFSAMMVFMLLWVTFVYFPIAHMVWYWDGPDAVGTAAWTDAIHKTKGALDGVNSHAGLLNKWGALDFAGGTVVHINAGIAGLVGALYIGKRKGFGKDVLAPHSLTMTMIGASLLWVGWFGFNAGSALEAGTLSTQAFMNTFMATAAAGLSWALCDQIVHGKPSLLGAASGVVAGLVAVTPASGYAGVMGSILLGFLVSPLCFFFVSKVKAKFNYDDALDVFGVHCIGGIFGALMTGILTAPFWMGQGSAADYAKVPGTATSTWLGYLPQLTIQAEAVIVTLLWSGLGSLALYFIVDKTMGLRPTEEAEQMGLDLSDHGERAYNY
jgi:Amt family ammonium transporter